MGGALGLGGTLGLCCALGAFGCGIVGCTGDLGAGAGETEPTTSAGEGGAAGAVAASSGSGGAASSGSGSEGGSGAGGDLAPWMPVDTDWCAEDGYLGLDDGVCFYAPASPAGVLVFLHGMLPPDGSPATMQLLAKNAADQWGYAVLFPRGEQGLCSWDPSVEDWWCFPTSRANVDAHAARLAASWDDHVAQLEAILSADLGERYVLGFSNGGYFASYIGLEGWWSPLAGAGLVAAGRAFVDTSLLADERPPFYIAVGALDGQQIQDSAQNLAYVLNLEGWSNDYVVHAGSGHTIMPLDFDMAWSAWTSP